jgi:hypothetical protein
MALQCLRRFYGSDAVSRSLHHGDYSAVFGHQRAEYVEVVHHCVEIYFKHGIVGGIGKDILYRTHLFCIAA